MWYKMNKIVCIFFISLIFLSCSKKINTSYSVNIKEGLKIRDSNSIDSKIINIIPYGNNITILLYESTQVRINNILNNWCKIRWDNIEGWALNANLLLNNNHYVGTYELIYDYVKPTLKLNKDMSFKMTINFCQGLVDINGKYFVFDKRIILNFDPIGFIGNNDSQYILEIISNNKFKFISNTGLCAPGKDSIFIKNQ
jgi:hypothetical protein